MSNTATHDTNIVADAALCAVTDDEIFASDRKRVSFFVNDFDCNPVAILRPLIIFAAQAEVAAQLDKFGPQYKLDLVLREDNVVHRRQCTEVNRLGGLLGPLATYTMVKLQIRLNQTDPV